MANTVYRGEALSMAIAYSQGRKSTPAAVIATAKEFETYLSSTETAKVSAPSRRGRKPMSATTGATRSKATSSRRGRRTATTTTATV